MKTAVIMSCYNGTEFIETQINSILQGAYSDFTLFIRDDGSTDGTIELLKEKYGSNPKIHLILGEDNLGFGGSFSKTLKIAYNFDSYDFFAFCDQDDYWESEKLLHGVNKLKELCENTPNLYASNYYICDDSLNIKSTFNDGNPMNGVTFENMFFEGVFPGFTMVINKELAKRAFIDASDTNIFYHDKWVSLIALAQGGKIIYDNTPLAKYRRHEGAVSATDLGIISKIKWRINNVLNGDFCPRTRTMLVEYRTYFYNQSTPEIKHFLDVFSKNSIAKKLFYPHRLRRSISGEILLRIILLLGKL